VHGCRTTRLAGREHGPPGRCTLLRNRATCPSASEAMASGSRACTGCQPAHGSGPWQPKAVETAQGRSGLIGRSCWTRLGPPCVWRAQRCVAGHAWASADSPAPGRGVVHLLGQMPRSWPL